MNGVLFAAAALLAVFALLAVGIVVWSRGVVRSAGPQNDRERLHALASSAATDESGQALVTLLNLLDDRPPGAPVQVDWVHHVPAKGASGMLVKITWDGNEWRQIHPVPVLLAALRARSPRGVSAQRLVDELEVLSG